MLRFLWKLGLLLPIPLGVAWINWHVDPAKALGQHDSDPARYKYENLIAASLIAGRPEPLVAPHNQLILNELMFRSFTRLDVLVLGDSVAKPVHKGLCGGGNFFNAAAFGVGLEEMVAFDELVREYNLHPKLVVLEVDPAMLRPRRVVMLSRLGRLAHKASARLGVAGLGSEEAGWLPSLASQYDTLLSPSYCQYCIRLLLRGYFAPTNDRIQAFVQYAPPNRHIMYPDGSVQWCEVFLYATPESIRQSVGKVPEGLMTSVLEPPDRERCKFLEAFLSDVLQSGAKVEIFLPPLNPRIFEVASSEASDGRKVAPGALAESYLRRLARERGIRVRGSYQPQNLGVRKRTSWTSCICDGRQLNGSGA